jgi:hypothetical protein|uniref:Uncharacterized protein n=1 Tax=Ignisphaera aggregans TaxID=334771 RepID=A0A7J3Z743_9CREN
MFKISVLRALTLALKNVSSKIESMASNLGSKKAEESTVEFADNRERAVESVVCIPLIPGPVCYERSEDGYLRAL